MREEVRVTTSTKVLLQARDRFLEQFGSHPQFAAIAPGRVNLIGEHVDYNDGFVLPMAIDRYVAVCASPGVTGKCRLRADADFPPADFPLAGIQPGEPAWANFVRGVIAGIQERGFEVPTFDAAFAADLPTGGGLSSSAALEVSSATVLEALTRVSFKPVEKALLCQKAEHDFAGMPCGIMDQFAVTLAREDHLLLLDCRDQSITQVPAPPAEQIAVVIANSNVKHSLAESAYAERRQECEDAAKILEVASLRDAYWIDLETARSRLSDPLFRRARHVITEIERTVNCANRLRAGEWTAVAGLLFSSHESLRDDYEVSCPELDALVEIAQSPNFDGLVYGSRMTGGGFGGSTVSLVDRRILERFMETLEREYREKTGIQPEIFATQAVGGARLMAIPD